MGMQNYTNKTPGTNPNKHHKSSKKAKILKKPPDVKNVTAESETLTKGKEPPSLEELSEIVLGTGKTKTTQLEKRKQEGPEWKCFKKADYQRLETVLEEGQLSSDETYSKQSHEEEGKSESETFSEIGSLADDKPKLPWLCGTSVGGENIEVKVKMEETQKQKQQQQQTMKKPIIRDKLVLLNEKCLSDDSYGEPVMSASKDSVGDYNLSTRNSIIFNGMVEILPIFSNSKFVCSRDALSVGECEDVESFERCSGKPSMDCKTLREFSCKKEILSDQFVGDSKDTERKFRFKLLTEKKIPPKTTSHFINSLLILAPFEEEIQSLAQTQSKEVPAITTIPEKEERRFNLVKVVYGSLIAIISLISMVLGMAWRSYQPPRFWDYILQFIPFIKRRRTFVELFFDQLIKILRLMSWENLYVSSLKFFKQKFVMNSSLQ